MDALKKAELAKRQGNSLLDFETPTEPAGLSLEPVPESPTPQSLEPSITEPTPSPSEPTRSKFPDLPSYLEELEVPSPPAVRKEPTEHPAPEISLTRKELARPAIQQEEPHRESPVRPPPRPLIPEPPRPSPATTGDVKTKSEQQAAKNVFVAKAKGDAEPSKKNRLFLIAVSAATLCSVIGIGGYFWWQLQPKSGLGAMSPSIAARPAPTAQVGNPAPGATAVAATATATTGTNPVATAVPPAPTLIDKVGEQVKQLAESTAPDEPKGKTSSRTAPLRPATPTLATDGDRVFTVTKSPLRVNPALSRGYDAYQSGDLAAARKDYQSVLKADPYNLDALRGMAVISLREDRPDMAESYFQRVLVSDPQDAFAIAGLANLHSNSNPGAAETRLKNIGISQPDNAAPHFALGNVYAAQEKWSEAQQAYFKAYSVEPGNPDILYNLAISLEHLRQNKLAVQYYHLATQAASNRPSAFDPAQAAARVRALQP